MHLHFVQRRSIFFACCLSFVQILAFALPSEVLNQDVSTNTLTQTICKSGYTRTVRPSSSFTNGIKKRLMRQAGLDFDSDKSLYELDHVIPLALGGHPRNPKNLALQLWEGSDGAKRKDRLEIKLQCLVCSGTVLLGEAQAAVWSDWPLAYKNYGRLVCKRPRGMKSKDYGD